MTEYLNRVHHGDCLAVMADLPPACVDLVVTSPPYADARKHDYGGVAPAEYVDWFLPYAVEMKRVLKPSGSFVLNIKEKVTDGERDTYVLRLILALREEIGLRWVEEYIWHKKNAMPGLWPHRFRDAWERLLHFAVGSDFKMNQDSVMVPAQPSSRKRVERLGENDRVRETSATGSGHTINRSLAGGRQLPRREYVNGSRFGTVDSAWDDRYFVYPSNVLHEGTESGNVGHSAAFPEWLPAFFIRLFTDEDDVVLDPFLGSGTTAVAAIRRKRQWIGIEQDDDYCALAEERIEKELRQPFLL